MNYDERHLRNKIHLVEDDLLRSKNEQEIEVLRNKLAMLRATLQKMIFQNNKERVL